MGNCKKLYGEDCDWIITHSRKSGFSTIIVITIICRNCSEERKKHVTAKEIAEL